METNTTNRTPAQRDMQDALRQAYERFYGRSSWTTTLEVSVWEWTEGEGDWAWTCNNMGGDNSSDWAADVEFEDETLAEVGTQAWQFYF